MSIKHADAIDACGIVCAIVDSIGDANVAVLGPECVEQLREIAGRVGLRTPHEPANAAANSAAPSPEVVRDQSVKPEQT